MKYFIDVYGCQMNAHDSEIIAGILEGSGYRRTEDPEDARVILIVSCAVREHAETRVLGRVAQLGGLGRLSSGPEPTVVLCGCVAQEHGESLLKKMKDLDLVVGPDCYRDLPKLIDGAVKSSLTEFRREDYSGIEAVRRDYPRSFVTIMRGCDNFCTYCIVPYVRGRERSRRREAVLGEVAELRSDGYGEITLLGQNVNSYRDGDTGFPELLKDVSEVAGDDTWVRFVTSNPGDLDAGTVKVMAGSSNVCRQLHLPVQSGSDSVLRAMNRRYDISLYLKKIEMLREAMPGIVLTTDVIAGFPGETVEDFQQTVELLEKVRFDYAFLFRYSERTGTAACDLPDQVPEGERLSRLNRLQELQRSITVELSRKLAGRTMEVLVTGRGRLAGQTAARTEGNRMVILEERGLKPGDRLKVRIRKADGWTHFGTLEG